MKIVQVMPNFGIGGAEIMCENLIYEQVKLGHDVVVISMYDYHSAITERLEAAGVSIIYLGKKSGLDISMIWKIKKTLKELSPDVVHTHRYCAQYAIPAAILARVKRRVHTLHSIATKENGKLGRVLNKFFFKHCCLTPVALSEAVRETVVKEYKLKKEKIPVIYNGIDLSKCVPKIDYSADGNIKIIHVGRFVEVKNHKGLVDAFEIFHAENPKSELWLIGDGEKRVEIQTYIKGKSIEGDVKFFGVQNNVYGILHDADIFTLTSIYEGIPMTLIEAMGTGLPIVATSVGGIPNMLTNNESAILTAVESQEIADAFLKLAKDEGMRKKLGQNAFSRSLEFSSEKMAKEYIEIYKGEIK